MKKRISILLVCLMAVQFITSCGMVNPSSEDTSSNDTTVDTTPVETEPPYNLPEVEDNNGRTFHILGAGNRNELFDAELTADIIDEAVYKRNEAAEDHLGIDITFDEKDSGWRVAGEYSATITSAVMAGGDAYNMFTGAMTVIPKLAMQNNFMNILDMNIDLENPWWVQNLEETAAINGKLFALIGDLSVSMYGYSAVTYVNSKIQEENNLPNFYDMVRDGKWTMDAMLSASKGITQDLNGDGKILLDEDQVAITSHYTPFSSLQASAQIDLMQKNGEELYFANLDNRLVTLYEKFIAATTDTTLCMQNVGEYEVWAEHFMENRNLFHISTLNTAKFLREMDTDFGILPLPKMDEAQKDYQLDVSQSTVLWAVPVNASDPEFTAKFCEVFAHYSKEYTIPAFYETTLQEKLSRNADTQEMLQLIRSSLCLSRDCYLNYCFTSNPFLTFATLIAKQQAPASYLESIKPVWEAELKDILKAYQ